MIWNIWAVDEQCMALKGIFLNTQMFLMLYDMQIDCVIRDT